MMVKRIQLEPRPGEVHVDVGAFFREIGGIYANMRAANREHLTWDEWSLWGRAAMRAGLVRREDLLDPDPGRGLGGMPFSGGGNPDAVFWRNSILRTWRRVREAKTRGESAIAFYRDELAARHHEVSRDAQREQQQRADRAAPAKSRGYTGAEL